MALTSVMLEAHILHSYFLLLFNGQQVFRFEFKRLNIFVDGLFVLVLVYGLACISCFPCAFIRAANEWSFIKCAMTSILVAWLSAYYSFFFPPFSQIQLILNVTVAVVDYSLFSLSSCHNLYTHRTQLHLEFVGWSKVYFIHLMPYAFHAHFILVNIRWRFYENHLANDAIVKEKRNTIRFAFSIHQK